MKLEELEEKEDFPYRAFVGDNFRSERNLGCGMVFHFIRSHKFDGVLTVFPGLRVAAGICDVLVGVITQGPQEIKLGVMRIVFNLKERKGRR